MHQIRNGIVVAGSRNLDTAIGVYLRWQLRQDIRFLAENEPQAVVIEGEARGVDIEARTIACECGLRVDRNPADWSSGRGAGYARNQAMVDKGERAFVYWNGTSRGSWHTATIAYKAGKLDRLVYGNGLIWTSLSRWHPIHFGENMMKDYDYLLAVALTERLHRNRSHPSFRLPDGTWNLEKLHRANVNARRAYTELAEWDTNQPVVVQVPERDGEEAYVGWYRFPSKSRAKQGKYHYTSPDFQK